MMSFGGGGFFLAASEAISVLNRQYTLPGIGSYAADEAKQQFATAVDWGRYAELFEYDAPGERLLAAS